MGTGTSSHRLSDSIMMNLAELSNLTIDELNEEYKEWQQKHPSGVVEKKEFQKYMTKILPLKSSDDIR